jgi:hypothetical protein
MLNAVSIFKHLLVGSAEGGMGWRDPTVKFGWCVVGCPEDEHDTACTHLPSNYMYTNRWCPFGHSIGGF